MKAHVVETVPDLGELYYRMVLIRRFEERLLALFDRRKLTGTTHTYLGQEATAVSALALLGPGDVAFSQHRSHGYFIAGGGDPRALFLEIVGDARGVCEGLGGSQHLCTDNFFSNGILAGMTGLSAGVALAEKLRKTGNIAVAFLGDGTLGEGLVYETFTLAALWKLPLLFVIENNRYAQTTPVELNLAGSMKARPEAFGIVTDEVESNDVLELRRRFAAAYDFVRRGNGPYCQIVHTYRMGPHSKGDDHRSGAERELWRKRDPLLLAAQALGSEAPAIAKRADTAAAAATEMPHEVTHVPIERLDDDRALIPASAPAAAISPWRKGGSGEWMAAHLQQTFAAILAEREEVYLLGEDILDPYGGAFKVWRGLSTAFPDRVLTTPISEAAIVAIANGLAVKGFRPIVEFMFGDFAGLGFDQICNHAAKFARMYAGRVTCPAIYRMPSGGYRGYGPTHSQSLEKIFLGIAGLVVTASDIIHDPALIWRRMLDLRAPCLHVENKLLYSTALPEVAGGRLGHFRFRASNSYFPTTSIMVDGLDRPPSVAVVTYGGMVGMAIDVAEKSFVDRELLVRVVVPSQLAPLPVDDLAAAISDARSLVVLEEGTERAGFGAEVIAALATRGLLNGKCVRRCAARDSIIPNSATLEREILPSRARLTAAILEAGA